MTPAKKNAAAQALGRRGGRAGTLAQNEARAKNGAQGGRPRRVCTTCGEPVVGGHADRRLDERCGAHGWRWQRAGDPPPPGRRAPRRRDDADVEALAQTYFCALLRDLLATFEREDDSVQREHAAIIKRLRDAVAGC